MLSPHVFLVFGATGDLMHRKLMPALHALMDRRGMRDDIVLVGASRSKIDDEAFRAQVAEGMHERGLSSKESKAWCKSHVYFQSLNDSSAKAYTELRERVEKIEQEHNLTGNRVLYLALPPQAFEDTIEKCGKSGLAKNDKGWTRLVIEKPFGSDLETAHSLNELVHRYFSEDQVYRIDHYLGKETVQNLLVFRLGNAMFESLWNREHIERVDIIVAEDVGLGSRAGYFDRAGTIRDMVQNHLTQLMTLVAMEVPAVAEADDIRYEKIKVLQSISPLRETDLVFGQYTRGVMAEEAVAGYREEPGVASDSETETYVAMRMFINNWRWQGVPFILQTGKRLPRRLTRIAVTFRRPPVLLFGGNGGCNLTPNVLHMTLQPDEGFSLSFEVKHPGEGYRVQTQHLRFRYEDAFGPLPPAYQTLIEDVIRGDQTLFVHAQEVEAAWKLYMPVLKNKPAVHFYAAGQWGPPEAARLTGNLPIALHA